MKKAKPSSTTVQICVKVDEAIVGRLDRLVPEMSTRLGVAAGRADVMRAALLLGLAGMEVSEGLDRQRQSRTGWEWKGRE